MQAIRVRTAALVETLSTSSSVSVLTPTQALLVKQVSEPLLIHIPNSISSSQLVIFTKACECFRPQSGPFKCYVRQ